ncbi:hypothetical protein [Pseudomonas jessenii]|jgi:hypothetical protein|uniref:hypothetical protein n=1 Tax=Pseudomonas jessenii TaxID=77298 RepID=UPI0030BD55E8
MMNRAERRHFEKEMSKILKHSGDVCGICGAELKHNSQTFGGIVSGNCVVLSGECCAHRLDVMIGAGVYINENIDATLSVIAAAHSGPRASPSETLSTVAHLRDGISALDKATDDLMRRGGVQRAPISVSISDNPWKIDDAAWFENHPNRSHRLRPMRPSEAESISPELMRVEIPKNHRWEILVRQVEKGQRIRAAFCRNTKANIPDVDEMIHAIFDVVCTPGRKGKISNEEVAALAAMYHIPSVTQRN